jgi:hypothetical protein
MMETSKQIKKIETRMCTACGMPFVGSQFQKYCINENCIDLRKENAKKRVPVIDQTVDNRHVCKTTLQRILSKNKKIIVLKCKAKNNLGQLCGNKFTVAIETKRTVYPKFCSNHCNAYKRERYLLRSL